MCATCEMRRVLGSGSRPLMKRVFDAGADVQEGEGMDGRVEARRQAGRVLVGLQLDAGQGVADGLRFDHPGRQSVDEQHVVGESVTRRHPELADGDPARRGEVDRVAILHDPARVGERRVDPLAGAFLGFGRHGGSGISLPSRPGGRPTLASGVRGRQRVPPPRPKSSRPARGRGRQGASSPRSAGAVPASRSARMSSI